MYFSVLGGIIPIPTSQSQSAATLKANLQAQVKKGVQSEARETYTTNVLAPVTMFTPETQGAGVVSSTVVGRWIAPSRVKIPKIAIACGALSAVDGSITANIVVGSGSYETGAVQATGTFTLTGTPTDTDTNTYTIGGHAAVSNQATANSLTDQAAADVIAINSVSAIAALGVASSVGAVVTFTANEYGTAGNGITTTSTSSAGDTVTANQAATAGGVNGTGIVVPQNDNSGQQGLGFCTNPAPAGSALFAQDIPFNTTVFPGLTTSGGSSAALGLIPTFYDAVFASGTVLTLRLNTPVGTGSLAGLVVTATMEIQPLSGTFPSQNVSPALLIPVPGVDI